MSLCEQTQRNGHKVKGNKKMHRKKEKNKNKRTTNSKSHIDCCKGSRGRRQKVSMFKIGIKTYCNVKERIKSLKVSKYTTIDP